MRSNSVKRIALYLSILNAFIIVLACMLTPLFLDTEYQLHIIVGLGIISLVLNYWVLRYVNHKFIKSKLRSIYKIINSSESTVGILQGNTKQYADDTLDKTEQEVILWANKKELEKTELKKMETYRKEFLGNVSHELKTPIFNVLGFVETLLDGGIDDENINRKYLKKAEKNIQRLIAIIEDLDKISRFESDQIQLDKESFDLNEVMVEVIEALEISADKYDVTVILNENLTVPFMVYADRDKIYQVIMNLVFNSIKYGTIDGWSKLSYRIENDKAEISISDNGIGIAAHHIPRLFERFYRVDTNRSRKLGGTGLGLAIVKHILEAHEQSIKVESTLGTGTVFTFNLDFTKSS